MPSSGRRDSSKARSTSSLTEVEAGPTFPRFSEFPYEIRRQIWSECIPSQCVIVNRRLFAGNTWDWALCNQLRPPFISQVCHQARRIALEHGSQVSLGKWSINQGEIAPSSKGVNLPGWLLSGNAFERTDKAWFNPKRDTFVLHHPWLSYTSNWAFPAEPFPCGAEFLLANDWTEPLRASNRIAFSTLGGFKCQGLEHSPPYLISADKKDRDSRIYITHAIEVRIPLSDAIDSGLFGLFGEKRVIMLDPHDTVSFSTLHQIARQPYDELLRAFASGEIPNPQQPYNSHEEVLKHAYLLSVLEAEKHREHDDCEWHWQADDFKCCDHSTMFDYTHPRVQSILNDMPSMRLAVLVILCDLKEWANTEVLASALQTARISDLRSELRAREPY